MADGTRAATLLALGAAAGLALAAADLVRTRRLGPDLPDDVAARVNGAVVRAEDLDRALAAVTTDRRDAPGDTERRHVLDRLIDEELLVQRAIALDLPRRDGRARADLVGAVIDSVVSEASAREPSADEVAAFYARNRDWFAEPGRVRLAHVFVHDSVERAREAAARLRAGEPPAAVAAAVGDREVAPLPDALLPPAKLREYLGPTATRTALELGVGEVSEPIRGAAGFHVVAVLEREPARVPPLAEIEPQVRAELQRRAGERALADYLAELRRHADVRVAAKAP